MKFVDRLKFTATGNSASALTIGAAVSSCRDLIRAIADGDLSVTDTNLPLMVVDGNGNWQRSLYDMGGTSAAPTLTFKSIISSSAANKGAVAFSGALTVFNDPPGSYLTGTTVNALNPATLSDAAATGLYSMITDSSGNALNATLAAMKSFFTGAAADTIAPTVPTGLASSNVTQTAATLSWTASTDNSGVAPTYEVSNDGTSWTAVSTLTYGFSTLTAGTLYTLQVRAVDGSGNRSAAASLQVTTAAASGDSTAPTMAGSITSSNVTQTGLTMAYSAGSDNVAVTRYDVSVDTGTANWIANGTNLTYTASTLTAGTAYTLRVRCVDAAGNVSNVLTASVTTTAAGTMASQYILSATNSASGAFGTAAMTGTQPNGYAAPSTTRVNIRSALTNSATYPAASDVRLAWGQSATTPPCVFAASSIAAGVNGSTQASNSTTVVDVTHLGSWTDSSSGFFGTVTPNSTLNAYGTTGTYYLWVLYRDGSSKVYDNNGAGPVPFVTT